jgi:hypothetical protein
MAPEMMRADIRGMVILVAPAFLICLLVTIVAYRRRGDGGDAGEPPDDGSAGSGRVPPEAGTGTRWESVGR